MSGINTREFLINSAETGRFIVVSERTGRRYFVEPIGSGRTADWGSYNPSTGEIENKKGTGKYTGSVKSEDSLIQENNGFYNIVELKPGVSPLSYIEELDSKYPDKTF